MRFSIIYILAFLMLSTTMISQETTSYTSRNSDLNVDNKLNIYFGSSYRNRGFGAMLNADYEIQMFDDNLTIGPSLGIGIARYYYAEAYTTGYGLLAYRTRYKPVLLLNPAVVAHYYFDWLIDDFPDNFDLFAKAKFGALLKFDSQITDFFPFDLSVKAGGRYHLNNGFSIYTALGYGTTYLDLGISINL